MFYVYVLLSLKMENWFYVGFTNDLETRFKKHNSKMVKSTKFYAPFKLVYYEAYCSEKDARIREKHLKNHQQRDLLKERIKNSLGNVA